MKPIYLFFNLGLGDAVICNGLVRTLADEREVHIPAYSHNLPSVQSMFSDLPNVFVRQVSTSDIHGKDWINSHSNTLVLGQMGDSFDPSKFDQEFYRQASVPFENRWTRFKFPTPPHLIEPSEDPYWFVHDDRRRGYKITKLEWKDSPPVFFPTDSFGHLLTDFSKIISKAKEIHCINSVFALLADSIPTEASSMVIHNYARTPNLPTFKKDWKILT